MNKTTLNPIAKYRLYDTRTQKPVSNVVTLTASEAFEKNYAYALNESQLRYKLEPDGTDTKTS